jgi:hypothetical protein
MKEKTTPPAAKRNLTPEQHTICQARSLGIIGRHAGSKPISRLRRAIARVSENIRKEKTKKVEE